MKNSATIEDWAGGRKLRPKQLLRTLRIAPLGCLLVALGVSQQVPPVNSGLPGPGRNSQGFPALPENANPRPDSNRVLEDSLKRSTSQKRLSEFNQLRHNEMASDTDKLVALASQLKSEVDKDDKNPKEPLTMLSVREVEQIEKLAHNVRDKMRATVGN